MSDPENDKRLPFEFVDDDPELTEAYRALAIINAIRDHEIYPFPSSRGWVIGVSERRRKEMPWPVREQLGDLVSDDPAGIIEMALPIIQAVKKEVVK